MIKNVPHSILTPWESPKVNPIKIVIKTKIEESTIDKEIVLASDRLTKAFVPYATRTVNGRRTLPNGVLLDKLNPRYLTAISNNGSTNVIASTNIIANHHPQVRLNDVSKQIDAKNSINKVMLTPLYLKGNVTSIGLPKSSGMKLSEKNIIASERVVYFGNTAVKNETSAFNRSDSLAV